MLHPWIGYRACFGTGGPRWAMTWRTGAAERPHASTCPSFHVASAVDVPLPLALRCNRRASQPTGWRVSRRKPGVLSPKPGPAGRPASGSMPMPSSGTTHADIRAGVGQATVVRPIGERSARDCSAHTCSSRPRSARLARRPGNHGIDGVQRAEEVVGPHDIIARVQAPDMDELDRLVVARIQASMGSAAP